MFSNDNESECLLLPFNFISNACSTPFCYLWFIKLETFWQLFSWFIKLETFWQMFSWASRKFLFTSQLWHSQFRISSPGLGFPNAVIIKHDFRGRTSSWKNWGRALEKRKHNAKIKKSVFCHNNSEIYNQKKYKTINVTTWHLSQHVALQILNPNVILFFL